MVPVAEVNGIVAPVLLPVHEDAELIGFLPLHMHIDWRFVNRAHTWAYERLNDSEMNPSMVYGVVLCIQKQSISGYLGEPMDYAISLRRLRCAREWMEWPYFNKAFETLHNAMIGSKSLGCKVCPHRGIRLEVGRRFAHPITGRSTIECPGHGAWFDLETGDYVGRKGRDELFE